MITKILFNFLTDIRTVWLGFKWDSSKEKFYNYFTKQFINNPFSIEPNNYKDIYLFYDENRGLNFDNRYRSHTMFCKRQVTPANENHVTPKISE